jgi:hypothetical protein
MDLKCPVFDQAFFQKPSGNSLLLYVDLGRNKTIERLTEELPKEFKRENGDLAGGAYDTFFENRDLSISVSSDQKCATLTLVSVTRREQ